MMQWMCVLGISLTLALPGIARSADVSASIAELKREPNIREVQKAALRYFGLDQEEVDSMRARAAWKAVMPVFEIGGGAVRSDVDDETINNEFSQDEVWVVRGVAGSAKDIRGKLSWNLPNLIFNSEELDVASLASAREEIIKEVTSLYYSRRHLQVDMLLKPAADTAALINNELQLEKLTALIDAMTGGWYGKKLRNR